jgi:predicted GNAT family acetyltransferase
MHEERGKGGDVLRTSSIRALGAADLPRALDLLSRRPVANVFVASRLLAAGLTPVALGADVWGYEVDGRLMALCYHGANLVPVDADDDAIEAFAEQLREYGRRCSSIVGAVDSVAPLWDRLVATWGPPREVRPRQPLMAMSKPSRVPADPLVRRVRREEFDILLPACTAMFTEEVGVSPNLGDGGALYRARVRELIAAGRSLARIENGSVVFKAEIGSATPYACQVQGVWVAPERRGTGLSVIGMAAVVEYALREIAPIVSLYVNDFNTRAVAAYRHVGFREVDTFMSVLF